MDTPLSKVALKRKCRLRVLDRDVVCPCCGAVMDSYGNRALVCACRGDRTVRDNVIRDLTYDEAKTACLNPEKEKRGLLPERRGEDGARQSIEHNDVSQRRPADVWSPRGCANTSGRPEAVDFAVTCGLRSDLVRQSAQAAEDIFYNHEQYKKSYKNTAQACEEQGLVFSPMVLEVHGGGWSLTSRRVLGFIAKQQAHVNDWCKEGNSLTLAQRLSRSLHRENARAIRKRNGDISRSSLGTVTDLADYHYEVEIMGYTALQACSRRSILGFACRDLRARLAAGRTSYGFHTLPMKPWSRARCFQACLLSKSGLLTTHSFLAYSLHSRALLTKAKEGRKVGR